VLVFGQKARPWKTFQNMVRDGEVVSLLLLISRFQAIGTTTLSKFVEKKSIRGLEFLLRGKI
jgi:hypothetical protein